MRRLTTILTAAALAAGLSALATPAFAQDDMGSNPITDFFDGLGFSAKEKPDIDYQERAPLVPPSQTGALPAPQAASASRGSQWPNDPDVAARAERKRQDNVVRTESYSYRMDRSPRLDPDEFSSKRTAGASVPTTAADATRGDNQITRSSREELEAGSLKTVAQPATGNRNRLTDPPTGYMVGNGVTAQAKPEEKGFLGKIFGN